MKLKSDLVFDLEIEDYFQQEENKAKESFSVKVSEDIIPNAGEMTLRKE